MRRGLISRGLMMLCMFLMGGDFVGVKIDMSGLEDFAHGLEAVQKGLQTFDADFMRSEFAKFVEINAADPNFPYDTGDMLNAFRLGPVRQRPGGGLTKADWENLAEYASFVNDGTQFIAPRRFWQKAFHTLTSEQGKRYAQAFSKFFDEVSK